MPAAVLKQVKVGPANTTGATAVSYDAYTADSLHVEHRILAIISISDRSVGTIAAQM